MHYEDGTYITDGCQLLPDIGLFHQTLGLGRADAMVINCKLGPHEVGSRIKRKKLPLMIYIFVPHTNTNLVQVWNIMEAHLPVLQMFTTVSKTSHSNKEGT